MTQYWVFCDVNKIGEINNGKCKSEFSKIIEGEKSNCV